MIDPRRLREGTHQALRVAYRNLIKRRPLSIEEELASPEKIALDSVVFDALGLSGAGS